ncbi:hypothetical protein B0T19DRAFT_278769 [Cercophora scortea]|uniref:Uncharacterized protein n=1 Tax=Cercophora scortea TaxID=314031 RepID=A0AAE0I832_9PEZI|nr:hypothetical protein B0T19DRAFT_278769 [Cercophora scortea]
MFVVDAQGNIDAEVGTKPPCRGRGFPLCCLAACSSDTAHARAFLSLYPTFRLTHDDIEKAQCLSLTLSTCLYVSLPLSSVPSLPPAPRTSSHDVGIPFASVAHFVQKWRLFCAPCGVVQVNTDFDIDVDVDINDAPSPRHPLTTNRFPSASGSSGDRAIDQHIWSFCFHCWCCCFCSQFPLHMHISRPVALIWNDLGRSGFLETAAFHAARWRPAAG